MTDVHILTLSAVAMLALASGAASLPRPTNVPELMRTFVGEPVKSLETWEKVRKPEIRQRFLERMYGVRPVAAEKPDVSFAPAEPDREMPDGQAVRKRVKISYRGPYGESAFVATAFIPKSDRPVPAFVLICNRDPKENLDPDRKVKSDFWPVEQIVARGYAAIAFFNGDVAPETYNPATAFLSGVFACYERPQDRTDRSWGTLSAWAWGASRVLDWIETEPLLDAKRVAVVGHSRGGKTALLAGATDERWAMTCVNDSGCGGAKLANVDLPASEYYAIFLGSRVTYWFCGAFQKYCMNHDRRIERIDAWKDRWPFVCEPLSVDQHQWAAMVAPRLLAIGSATEDHGAGPLGEFYTALLASPAWELYGRRGLAGDEFPPPMAPVAGGDVSYHLRAGKHDLTAYDWSVYMDFADRHGWRQARPAGRRGVLPAASSASAGDLIDPMIGTDGTGHAFPGPARPFGLVQPSPDTGNGDWDHCSGYAARDRSILRFSQTHLNGTGQTSLGDVGILPFVGTAPLTARGLCASFSKTNECASPGCYRVKLDNGVRVEIAAGRRVARYRLTFPNDRPSGVLLDFGWGLYRQADYLPLLTTTSRVERVSDCCLRGENTSEVFAPRTIGFAVRFDRRPDWLRELPRNEGDRAACFVAEYGQGGTVELVVAVSSRSARGAERNLAAEGDVPFDRLVAETRSEWKVLLDRLDLTGLSEDEGVSAATALYHLCLQPNDISDAGEPPRYSTFSLWDTFRDAHPLYERLVPERVPGFVTSLLSHYDAWGYLPQWELWGRETGCMIGSHAVPVVVDACLHGFLKGPDVEKAYRAVRDTLTKEERPGKGALYPQRTDWKVYDAYGYYPFDLIPRESVSRTLECCVDDFKAAQLARSLGHDEDAAFFERRSWNFTNLFDRATLCFRGKDTKGRWREPFEPARAGQADFTEGSPLQYSWYVPCRPDWLVAAMGGPTAFERRLDAFFAGTLFPGAERCYNRDITGLIGDYAHGNEPCQHVPNLYRLVGRDDKAEALVARIGREFYRNAPDGLSGNDDCGQMSAWYLRHVILKRQGGSGK